MNLNKCKNCAMKDPNANVCKLTKWEIKPEIDSCPQFIDVNHLTACASCGVMGPEKAFIYLTDNKVFICPKCHAALGTCEGCGEAQFCEYETNASPLPKLVPRQVRQGNMIMTTQARNPEREKITCQAGCKCYNIDYGCSRDDGCCANYNERSM